MYLVQLEEWERNLLVSAILTGVESKTGDEILRLMRKLTNPEESEIKLNFQIFIQNNGDGSASTIFFNEEKEAEAYAGEDDERLCDDIFPKTITVNGLGKIKDIIERERD